MQYLIHTQAERRLAVAKLQGGFFCVYCEELQTASSLQVEHVIPRARGGTDDLRNLVLACSRCNIKKSDKDADVLAASGYETLAQKVMGIQAMRADWGPDEVKARLAAEVEGIDPGYNAYEKFITETPTAKVINAALTYAKMSVSQVRKRAGLAGWTLDRLRNETMAATPRMWHRLHVVTEYPMSEFLKVHRRWISKPDCPQRELEYAAALRGLTCVDLARELKLSPNYVRGILRQEAYLQSVCAEPARRDALVLRIADACRLTPAEALDILTRICMSKHRDRPVSVMCQSRKRTMFPHLKRSEIWQNLFEAYCRQFRSYRVAARELGISNPHLHSLRTDMCFPSAALLKTICAAEGRDITTVLFEIEAEWLAALGQEFPPELAGIPSMEMLLYLAEQNKHRLALFLGIHPQSLNRTVIRKGRCGPERLARIASFVGVSVEEAALALRKSVIVNGWR